MQSGGQEPIVCKSDMAPLMTTSGSLTYRKILADNSLKSRALQVMLSTFATKHVKHAFSPIYC